MMWNPFIDTWIIVIGALCAVSCALLGNFLLLRRMSMMGDAISHAVLPGLALAFLLTESLASVPMFIGAAIMGVLTAMFTQWVHTFGNVDRSASMGIVFTTLFAIGLVLIVQAADYVDLDAGCVLYGAIELEPLFTIGLFGFEVPRSMPILSVLVVINLAFVLLFFKELRISTFDPALATTMGINAQLMHYVLMALVAVTTVASFQVIGSILVIAMLIVPAACAHLLTDRLGVMVFISAVIAAASAVLGHLGAIGLPIGDVSTAAMIAVAAGGLFVMAFLFAPRHGVLSRLWHRLSLRMRINVEDALGALYRVEEADATIDSEDLRRAVGMNWLVGRLVLQNMGRRGLISLRSRNPGLTIAGRARAMNLVRTHRLWERYLHDHLNIATDHVHATAHRVEHHTTPELQQVLELQTNRPETDPHGKEVPRGRS